MLAVDGCINNLYSTVKDLSGNYFVLFGMDVLLCALLYMKSSTNPVYILP